MITKIPGLFVSSSEGMVCDNIICKNTKTKFLQSDWFQHHELSNNVVDLNDDQIDKIRQVVRLMHKITLISHRCTIYRLCYYLN